MTPTGIDFSFLCFLFGLMMKSICAQLTQYSTLAGSIGRLGEVTSARVSGYVVTHNSICCRSVLNTQPGMGRCTTRSTPWTALQRTKALQQTSYAHDVYCNRKNASPQQSRRHSRQLQTKFGNLNVLCVGRLMLTQRGAAKPCEHHIVNPETATIVKVTTKWTEDIQGSFPGAIGQGILGCVWDPFKHQVADS